jgi:hypothetical protein
MRSKRTRKLSPLTLVATRRRRSPSPTRRRSTITTVKKRSKSPPSSHQRPTSVSRKTMASVYVVWMRHCESRSNVGKTDEDIAYVEALCTCTGVQQSFASGSRTSEYIEKRFGKDAKVHLFSSALPRAMQTAQDVSSAMHSSLLEKNPKVHRLPYITERWGDDEEIEFVKGTRYGSANTATIVSSNSHARALNARRVGAPIVVNRDATRLLLKSADASHRIAYKTGNYTSFLEEIVPTLQTGPKNINLIVGHGWYIWQLVIKSAEKSRLASEREEVDRIDILENTEAIVVRYDLSSDKSNVLRATLIGHIAEPDEGGLEAYFEKAPKGLKRFATSPKSPCKCNYNDKAIVDKWTRVTIDGKLPAAVKMATTDDEEEK